VDTVISGFTWAAALTAAGGVRKLVEALGERDDASTGFAVARPPGHHALRNRAMGFCIFNNVAVAATWLRSRGATVLILDWDVHHGNGTQALVTRDPGIVYLSMHQEAFYPFEGFPGDIDFDAPGTTINVPLPSGTAGDAVRHVWSEVVIPVVTQFAPDWILVSAGYDAHVNDPLADLRLIADDYGWMASTLASVHPPNRTVYALEGGYDLEALRDSVRATLLGASGVDEWGAPQISPPGTIAGLGESLAAVRRHWDI
jgi:acetoin utilization deacetylase AcuC-like enzyme